MCEIPTHFLTVYQIQVCKGKGIIRSPESTLITKISTGLQSRQVLSPQPRRLCSEGLSCTEEGGSQAELKGTLQREG